MFNNILYMVMSTKIRKPFTEVTVEKVAELCLDKFETLPKTGKPSSNEWTILAGVVMQNRRSNKHQVVSIGCGTKCIGNSKLCSRGLILNDSHAEVMARRGLIRFLYHQLNKAIGGDEEGIFDWLKEKQKFHLKHEISFHFFSTQTPCGDACIKTTTKGGEYMDEPLLKKAKIEEIDANNTNIGSIIDSVYTGAKLIGDHHIDAMEQVVGPVRTKPGRGERTLSMSCSDKIAKWQIMGMQGALLDYLLATPIYFDTLNFCDSNSIDSLERAIWKRFKKAEFQHSKYKLHVPQIRICNNLGFQYAQDNIKQPSPNGLVWCDIPNNMKPFEISVNGKRQGITTKKKHTLHSALKISKFFLLKEFINVIKLQPGLLSERQNFELKTYSEYKFLAENYQNAWLDLKLNYFKQWTQKPENLLQFSIEEVQNNFSNHK